MGQAKPIAQPVDVLLADFGIVGRHDHQPRLTRQRCCPADPRRIDAHRQRREAFGFAAADPKRDAMLRIGRIDQALQFALQPGLAHADAPGGVSQAVPFDHRASSGIGIGQLELFGQQQDRRGRMIERGRRMRR